MSDEWISAIQAGEIVVPGSRHVLPQTSEAIRCRAEAGIVKAKATLFKSTRAGVESQKQNHPVPKEFWGGELLEQNWAQGDFSVSMQIEEWPAYCEALGVTFERKGIEAMAQPVQTSAFHADPPSMADELQPGVPPANDARGDKLPSLSDADLNRWWDRLSELERNLPADTLHKQCAAAYPNNSIARQRVRSIAPHRKPGPRPITPKSKA